MTRALLFAMPGNEAMTELLAIDLGAEVGLLQTRKFPDGETYLRFQTQPVGRSVSIVATLADPNGKILPFLFAVAAARDLGAARVGLVTPYLAYMRQDRRFHEGEAVTSRYLASLLSGAIDWLATVDPHLHRLHGLSEIFTVPTRVAHAAPLISAWIKQNTVDPIVIGPDRESEQWVAEVARAANAPYTILEKLRLGDRAVEIKIRDVEPLVDRTPVLVDDIIASGQTMLEAMKDVRKFTRAPVTCIAIHGIFSNASDQQLLGEGARVITTNTIPHATNALNVSRPLADAFRDLL